MKTVITLTNAMFSEKELVLIDCGPMKATTFRYESGVAALRIQNERGEMVCLPFQGQQIWSARFDGRDLTMVSMFSQPNQTRTYLENYGGFLIHCGFTAMGVPGPEDHHPLHGELPNAPYQKAFLVVEEGPEGCAISLGGSYQHTVAFSTNYVAEPLITLRSGSALIQVQMTFTNLKNSPMEYMYLAHANFRPMNGGQLQYTARVTPQTVRVRSSIPSHVHPKPGYREFLNELARKPELHHNLTPDLSFDPEVVLYIDYLTDTKGCAYTMQLHPDGTADYLMHKPAELPIGVRWICRTADQDALGMILPATAEPEGYSAEIAKGNVRTLDAKQQFSFAYDLGLLSKEEAAGMSKTISEIIAKG